MNIREVINTINPLSKDYETINLINLQSALQTSKGAKIISLITITIPDFIVMPILECPFDYELVKISYINGIINFDYSTAVNKQREKEAAEKLGLTLIVFREKVKKGEIITPEVFVSQLRKWGTRLPDSPFVSHVLKTGEHKLYLEVKIERSIAHQYYQPSQSKIYNDEIVKPFLNSKSNKTKELQDVEKEIILRDYWVKNIAAIVIEGKGYFIQENLT